MKKLKTTFIGAIVFLSFQSVAGAAVSAKPLWEAKIPSGSDLTEHVQTQLDTLGKDLLNVVPADYKTFCPTYKTLTYSEKKDFWAYLMSAMVKYESNFNTKTFYKEGFGDSRGAPVVSRGLLQISIESGNAYGCGLKSTNDLHDPYQNLSCGIRILNRWVGRDARMAGKVSSKWRGGARYWSVLRTASGSYSKIVALAKANPLCK